MWPGRRRFRNRSWWPSANCVNNLVSGNKRSHLRFLLWIIGTVNGSRGRRRNKASKGESPFKQGEIFTLTRNRTMGSELDHDSTSIFCKFIVILISRCIRSTRFALGFKGEMCDTYTPNNSFIIVLQIPLNSAPLSITIWLGTPYLHMHVMSPDDTVLAALSVIGTRSMYRVNAHR